MNPVAKGPFYADSIQTRVKVRPGFLHQHRMRWNGRIHSEPFQGLLTGDLPWRVSLSEGVDIMDEVDAKHIMRIHGSIVTHNKRL